MVGIFLLLFLFASEANSKSCTQNSHLVTRVIDGDTIEIEDGRVFRSAPDSCQGQLESEGTAY